MRRPIASFLLFDSNIETVPLSYSRLPQIARLARRFGKEPGDMLLDRSLHHFILKQMPDGLRRGRPDIVHLSILSITDSPAYKEGLVNLVLHTIGGLVITSKEKWRPPRNYMNFLRLFEGLLKDGRVPKIKPILLARSGDLNDALKLLRPKKVVLFSSRGRLIDLRRYFESSSFKDSAFLIGAYPRGEPNRVVLEVADDIVSIYPKVLSSWIVASRVVYELERTVRI